jgi:diguanylate cyclase (GGDEF)-like protein/PAS domain S-box-containing protein
VKTSLLLVAHGGGREASNEEVMTLARRLREGASGRFHSVTCAFLELAEPSIPAGIEACIAQGAEEVIVLPYFLSAGRHVSHDVPSQVERVRRRHPRSRIRLAPYLGSAEDIDEVVLSLAAEADGAAPGGVSHLRSLAAFSEHNPNPIVMLDGQAHVVYQNIALRRCLTKGTGLCAGDMETLLSREVRPATRQCLETSKPIQDREYSISGRTWLVSFFPMKRRGLVYAYFHEITYLKQAQRLLAAQNKVLTQVARGHGLRAPLKEICLMVDEQTGGMSLVLLVQADGKTLGGGVAPNLPPDYAKALDASPIQERSGSYGTAAHRGEPVIVADISTDPLWEPFQELAQRFDIKAGWSFPIKSAKGRLLGTFSVSHHEIRRPTQRDLEVITNGVALAAVAIEHHQSGQGLRLSEQSVRELCQVASMRHAGYLEQLQALLRMGCRRFRLSQGAMIRSHGDEFLVVAVEHRGPGLKPGDVIHPLETFCGVTLNAEGPIAVEQAGETVWKNHPAYASIGDATYLGCAVHVNGRPYGVLSFSSQEPYRRRFTPAERELIRLMARWVGSELERLHSDRALSAEKGRALVTLESIGDAVITTDHKGRVNYLNPVAERLTGWSNHEAHGQALDGVFRVVHEETHEPVEDPVARCLVHGAAVHMTAQSVLVNRQGEEIAIEDSASPIRDHDGVVIGCVMVFHDVRSQRELKQRLSYQATHDALTGLANRLEFENRLRRAIDSARHWEIVHSLLYMDLDQFKVVNDTSGHMAGDELLRQLSGLLQDKIRDTDALARLGGDEFGVLLQHCPVEKAEELANELLKTIKGFRFAWEPNTFELGASIGVVTITAASASLADVLSTADMACYAAKDAGRNRVYVYGQHDTAVKRKRGEMLWVARLRAAIEEDLFRLYCQPLVPFGETPDRPHCEVLLRLQDTEEEGPLAPQSFIPAAERYGLMPSIDRWVIHTLFRSYASAQTAGRSPGMISINLSAASLTDEPMLDYIRNEFAEHAMDPNSVCFEVTETAAIDKLPRAVQFMEQLRGIGCRFALDDFGSGLSSYGYLKTLPVDYLKIDGRFVKDIHTDKVARAIIESITHVAHVMGIETVAEWVENEETLDILQDIGVDYAQGYYIRAPGPLSL